MALVSDHHFSCREKQQCQAPGPSSSWRRRPADVLVPIREAYTLEVLEVYSLWIVR